MIETALRKKDLRTIHHYYANVATELGEHEIFNQTAVSIDDAKELARESVSNGLIGLSGHTCEPINFGKRSHIYTS